MNGRGFITISMHELERVKIIEAVVQHRQTIVLAAERLQLCERQVSRLVRRYEAAGPAGLVSARRGQPSNRELPVAVRARAMALVIQAQRDDRRASGSPSRTNQGKAPRPKERKVGTRKQRELTREQLNEAILGTARMRVGSVLKSPLT
jgi:hypothetical protein